jgi:Leucine-rich repeat (LRR) protein
MLSSISKKSALRYVDLSHTSIDDSNVKHLFSRRVLSKLSLAGTQLTVKGINEAIAGCSTFALDIGELDLDDEAMSQLKLQNQRGLILRGNPITDKSLEPLASLQYLDMSDTKCTGAALEHLTQVFTLKLDGTLVDDSVIAKLLSANTVLKRLSIRNTRVTDATLKALAQHVSLRGLEIGDGEITPEGLIATAFAPSDRLALNSRKFNGTVFANWRPGIRCLDMSDSGLSDADLHHLGNIIGLQELSLAHCDVSDESLEKLEALNLMKLDLTGTKVTATAVEKRFQGSPVVHLSPAQCSQEEIAQSNTRGGLQIGVRFDLERY